MWGLVRSAQSEQPGRFVLAEVPEGFADWATVLASGESQVRVVDGRVPAPRLARRPLPTPTALQPSARLVSLPRSAFGPPSRPVSPLLFSLPFQVGMGRCW